MSHHSTDLKRKAHELLDLLTPAQVDAVLGILHAILDPVSRVDDRVPHSGVDGDPSRKQEHQKQAVEWIERAMRVTRWSIRQFAVEAQMDATNLSRIIRGERVIQRFTL